MTETASPSERTRKPRVDLDVDRIVDAAMAICDAEGPDKLTMRALAAELGVGVMSLYWYVPTKRELEGLLMERLMLESAPPDTPTGDWRTDLASIGWASRENLLKHPWMIDMFSSAAFLDEEAFGHGFLRHIENTVRMSQSLDLPLSERMVIVAAIDHLTFGSISQQITHERKLEQIGLTFDDFQKRLAPHMERIFGERDYPLIREFMDQDETFRQSAEEEYRQQLDLLLDGVAHRLEQRR